MSSDRRGLRLLERFDQFARRSHDGRRSLDDGVRSRHRPRAWRRFTAPTTRSIDPADFVAADRQPLPAVQAGDRPPLQGRRRGREDAADRRRGRHAPDEADPRREVPPSCATPSPSAGSRSSGPSTGTRRTSTGNVWYFGEDAQGLHHGQFVKAPRLVAGRRQRRAAGDHHAGRIRSAATPIARSTTRVTPWTRRGSSGPKAPPTCRPAPTSARWSRSRRARSSLALPSRSSTPRASAWSRSRW